MSKTIWSAVDSYYSELLRADRVLDETLERSVAAGLPSINVTPAQGKFLHLLARGTGARRILEMGTLGGYSTIWLARALPEDGALVTLESEPAHASVARENIERAGLARLVDIRISAALESLPLLAAAGGPPFDFIFIDADKANTAAYFEWAVKLSRVGTMIIVDNVVRGGGVVDAASSDPAVQGIRRFRECIAREARVSATVLQTVGSKDHDGFAMALVIA